MEIVVLDEKVVYQACDGYKRVVRWLKGVHPDKGRIVLGLTGWETVQEADVIPTRTFNVIEKVPCPDST